jgi:hypothetical protein
MDPEENLFAKGTLDFDNYDDDDDGDLSDQTPDMSFTNLETTPTPTTTDDKLKDKPEAEKGVFDIEEEEEEEKFSDSELETFNKKLGTDFKSVDDLKKSFQKEEEKSEIEKDEIEYEVLTSRVNLFDRFIKMDNEDLIRNQMISEYASNKKDINSQDIIDEIEEKIEGLKDLDQLDSMANTLRANINGIKEKAQASIDKIDEKRNKAVEITAKQNVENLQNAFSEILEKKEFMGVTVTKDILNEVYKDVRTDKFFARVNNDQGMIAKLAMFVRLEEEISKRANQPTHSDRTKNAFNALAGNSQGKARTLATANGSASGGDMDAILQFLK